MQYCLKTVIESQLPDGRVAQRVTVEEFSETPQEHIYKNMQVASGVLAAFGALADTAQKSLAAGGALPWQTK